MNHTYRVEAIALHNIGVFDDCTIEFPKRPTSAADSQGAEIHLFAGPNGSGKSTLLHAIATMFDPYSDALLRSCFRGKDSSYDFRFASEPGYAAAAPRSNVQGPPSRRMRFGQVRGFLLRDPASARFYGHGESQNQSTHLAQYVHRTNLFNPSNPLSQHRFDFAAFAYSGQRTIASVDIQAIQPVTNSPFENALSFDQTARPHVLLQWVAQNRTQAALARQDGDANAVQSYDLALDRITRFVHEVTELAMEFRLVRTPLAVKLRVNGTDLSFDSVPDGIKSILSWVADVALRVDAIPWAAPGDAFSQPMILLLDEVDIHLHPRWQRRILPAIQRLLPNAQVFASTHSPYVVGSVSHAWIYRLPEPGKAGSTLKPMPSRTTKGSRRIANEVFALEDESAVDE